MTPRILAAITGLACGLGLVACGSSSPEETTGVDDSGCLLGTEGCACLEGACIAGTVCSGGLCVDDGFDPLPPDPPQLTPSLDVLFIIDNSGTMASEQRRLADAIGHLAERLEASGLSLRFGFTTTDDGNPACNATTPESGALVLSSCRSRLEDFTWPPGDPIVDATAQACTDICELDGAQLEGALSPTPTAYYDGPLAPRPWIEVGPVVRNLPEDVTLADALRCAMPQGVAGCGFESPLRAVEKALLRSRQEDDPSYGFARGYADLLVVIVTDEVDCSGVDVWQSEVFTDAGDKVFWEDDTLAYPTSAVCWNAGVACSGSAPNWDDCVPQSYDVDGIPLSESESHKAVLWPVEIFRDALLEVHADWSWDGEDRLHVALIAGSMPDGSFVYADSDDPQQQRDFGIGPGCAVDIDGEPEIALPPVRMRQLVDELGGLHASICEPDYTPIMDRLADLVLDEG